MKVYHNVGYAPNPGKERRNQMPYLKHTDGGKKGKSHIPESPIGRGTLGSNTNGIFLVNLYAVK